MMNTNDESYGDTDDRRDIPPAVPTESEAAPPPPVEPRPQKRKNRGGGCMKVFLLIILVAGATAFFFFVTVAGIGGLFGSFGRREPGPRIVEEVVSRQPGVEDKVVIINVKGIITSNSPYDGADANRLRYELQQAGRDPHVVAVVLDLDTPGGEVIASDEIYHAVRQLGSEGQGKPIVACMRSMCASGGYYIAAASDYIFANPLTLTGSIGVIVPTFRYTELLEKVGVELKPYKSGPMKDMLSGGSARPASAEMFIDSYMNDLVQKTFRRFATVVAQGRQDYATADDVMQAPFGDGRILLGKDALDYGLVDQLGYFDEAVAKARELAGAYDANVVRYRESLTLKDILFSMQAPREIKIQSQLLEVIGEADPRKLYYLMPILAR